MRNPKKKTAKKKSKAVQPVEVWRPGVDVMEEGEELQFDPSAYHCLHPFRLNWPCLSFDIMRDELGENRTEFPHSMFLVAGTQADSLQGNSVALMKLSNLGRLKQPRGNNEGEEGDMGESSSSSEDEGEEGGEGERPGGNSRKPIMQVRSVAHHGGVNRIRAMAQKPQICATWGESGYVQVWDLSSPLKSVIEEVPQASPPSAPSAPAKVPPLQIFGGHKGEGFALDWSPVGEARLLTGDCQGKIFLWEPSESKWAVQSVPYTGHSGSVEDIQWSPSELGVFASSSTDQSLAIWDVRTCTAPALSVKAHSADVNVISWNRLASCMLASGADDGTFRIWDLRAFKAESFVAHFKYHSSPITSIQWSASDSSTVALSSQDNQLTIWDLSLERDPEEEAQYQMEEAGEKQAEAPSDLPPQLMFVHQGQSDIKELHWHPQISGMLVSTAKDGFNAFRPSNI